MHRSELPKTVTGEPRAFFGRRSGKRLHSGQEALYRDTLPQLQITFGEEPFDLDALLPDTSRKILEIGYGGGEHLALEAARHPETGYIGSEVFTGGIAKLVQTIAEEKLGNIRLFTDDALKLLFKLPDASLDEVFLLYPDPWPKTRHHKRRFISNVTVRELARVLKADGRFHFATDIEDYATWTLAHIVRSPLFEFAPARPGLWHEPYPGWEPTRYEEKARREGRLKSFYFTFLRRSDAQII